MVAAFPDAANSFILTGRAPHDRLPQLSRWTRRLGVVTLSATVSILKIVL